MDEIAASTQPHNRYARIPTSEFGRARPIAIDDPEVVAYHFAALILWMPLDRALFLADDESVAPAELERLADAAIRVFFAAYGK